MEGFLPKITKINLTEIIRQLYPNVTIIPSKYLTNSKTEKYWNVIHTISIAENKWSKLSLII